MVFVVIQNSLPMVFLRTKIYAITKQMARSSVDL